MAKGELEHPLLEQFEGPLHVCIEDLGHFTPDFKPEILGEKSTLFDYVGHTAAVLGTNMTTRLQIAIAPTHWEIVHFNPGERVLEVRQIGGENIDLPPDDLEALDKYFTYLDSYKD